MQYWLMKSEPDVFSIDDLASKKSEPWDGVRNYQARNFMRAMRKGDQAFFYHSNCQPPAIVGIMTITQEASPDPTSFASSSPYYDPKSSRENPRWDMVEVSFEKKFTRPLSLDTLKSIPELADLQLVRRGNRLSIMPVPANLWQLIVSLATP